MSVVGSLNCTEWSLLPPATAEMAMQISVVSGRFMGDPSHEYEHTELQKGTLIFLIKINVYFSFEDATNEVGIHKTQWLFTTSVCLLFIINFF